MYTSLVSEAPNYFEIESSFSIELLFLIYSLFVNYVENKLYCLEVWRSNVLLILYELYHI